MTAKIKVKWLIIAVSFAAIAIAFFSITKDATAMIQKTLSVFQKRPSGTTGD